MALSVVAAVALGMAVYLDDVFENFQWWTQVYERWHLDEAVVVAVVLAVAFGFYSWRRRTELANSEARFRSLVENTSDTILRHRVPSKPRRSGKGAR